MRRKKDKSTGITALYERLSRDDDNAGESNSIVHQKQMLEDYAMKHGFTNLVHFTDDGWSGATFDRPSWNRLVEGVKNGDIMRMYLDIDDNGIIQEAKFKTFGCGAAVATSSMATELVKGQNLKN